jgi:hypothetical protein
MGHPVCNRHHSTIAYKVPVSLDGVNVSLIDLADSKYRHRLMFNEEHELCGCMFKEDDGFLTPSGQLGAHDKKDKIYLYDQTKYCILAEKNMVNEIELSFSACRDTATCSEFEIEFTSYGEVST